MEPKLQITGERNDVRVPGVVFSRTVIRIKGADNVVEFGQHSTGKDLLVNIAGNGNKVLIGKNCKIRGHILVKGNDQTISIGDFTTFTECYLLAQEGCNIAIGKHCMFSRGIEIRTTDAHSVIDVVTGERTNTPKSVVIGNHVWIAANVLVSKGVSIADDCIIGAGSTVLRDIRESQCVAVGSPAVPLRRGVTWNRARKPKFKLEEMNAWRTADAVDVSDASDLTEQVDLLAGNMDAGKSEVSE